MLIVAGNAQHIGKRGEQQDAFGFTDPGSEEFVNHAGFAAVLADGMGGMAHGRAAACTGVQAFVSAYTAKTPDESIPVALERSVRAANDAVFALSHEFGAAGNVGSTLTVCVVHSSGLYWASVGDSAAFLVRGRAFVRLNIGHTYSVYLDRAVAAGQITDEEAASDPQRDALTSYLGIESLTEIEGTNEPVILEPGDRILLASDGLFKTLTFHEIGAELHGPVHQLLDRLVRATIAKNRPYQDNVTVLAVDVLTEITEQPLEPVTDHPPAAAAAPPTPCLAG